MITSLRLYDCYFVKHISIAAPGLAAHFARLKWRLKKTIRQRITSVEQLTFSEWRLKRAGYSFSVK